MAAMGTVETFSSSGDNVDRGVTPREILVAHLVLPDLLTWVNCIASIQPNNHNFERQSSILASIRKDFISILLAIMFIQK